MNEFDLIKNYFQKLTKNNPSSLKLNDDVFFDKLEKYFFINSNSCIRSSNFF